MDVYISSLRFVVPMFVLPRDSSLTYLFHICHDDILFRYLLQNWNTVLRRLANKGR